MQKHVVILCLLFATVTTISLMERILNSPLRPPPPLLHRERAVPPGLALVWKRFATIYGNTSKLVPESASCTAAGTGEHQAKTFWRFRQNRSSPELYDAFAKGSVVILIFSLKQFKNELFLQGGNFNRELQLGWTSYQDEVPCFGIVCPHGHTLIVQCQLRVGIPLDVRTKRQEDIQQFQDSPYCIFPDRPAKLYFLAACTMVRLGEHTPPELLAEWVAYHILQGFEHITIYTDESPQNVQGLLRHYIANGSVQVMDWESPSPGFHNQQASQNSCLWRYRGLAQWVALHDIDEFLQPLQEGDTVRSVMERQDNTIGALVLNNVFFAPSNPSHVVGNAQRLRTQTWLQRESEPLIGERMKCIGRPEHIDTFSVHVITHGRTSVTAYAKHVLRLSHFKNTPLSQPVPDTSMLQFGEVLLSEVMKALNKTT